MRFPAGSLISGSCIPLGLAFLLSLPATSSAQKLGAADWVKYTAIQKRLDQEVESGRVKNAEGIRRHLRHEGRELEPAHIQAALDRMADDTRESLEKKTAAGKGQKKKPVPLGPLEAVEPWSDKVARARKSVALKGLGELARVLREPSEPHRFAALEACHVRGISLPSSLLRETLEQTTNGRVAKAAAYMLSRTGVTRDLGALARHVAQERPGHISIEKYLRNPAGRMILEDARAREERRRLLVRRATGVTVDDDRSLRAIDELAEFRSDPRVQDLLRTLSEDPDGEIRHRAREALRGGGGAAASFEEFD